MALNSNVGWVERVVRLLLGLPLATSYLYVRHFYEVLSYVLLVGGIALLISAVWGWCPVHFCLGTSTVKKPLTEPQTAK